MPLLEKSFPPLSQLALKTLFGLVLSAILLTGIWHWIDWNEFKHSIMQIHGVWVAIAFGFYVAIYLFRAIRFMFLTPGAPFATMLWITCVHNLMLRIMPLRLGELAYGVLTQRAQLSGLGQSMLSLIFIRLIDSTMVIVLFAISLAYDHGQYRGNLAISLIASLCLIVVGIVFILAFAPLLRCVGRMLVWLSTLPIWKAVTQISSRISQLGEFFISQATIPPHIVYSASGITFLQWIFNFLVMYAILRSLRCDISIARTILGGTASVVTGFLPISGIGSFGTFEAGWTLGFILVGLEAAQAASTGFVVSVVTFLFAVMLGIFGWLMLSFHPRPSG